MNEKQKILYGNIIDIVMNNKKEFKVLLSIDDNSKELDEDTLVMQNICKQLPPNLTNYLYEQDKNKIHDLVRRLTNE